MQNIVKLKADIMAFRLTVLLYKRYMKMNVMRMRNDYEQIHKCDFQSARINQTYRI